MNSSAAVIISPILIFVQLIYLVIVIGVVVFMIMTVKYLRGIYLILKKLEEDKKNKSQ
jgi:hypothetical protein